MYNVEIVTPIGRLLLSTDTSQLMVLQVACLCHMSFRNRSCYERPAMCAPHAARTTFRMDTVPCLTTIATSRARRIPAGSSRAGRMGMETASHLPWNVRSRLPGLEALFDHPDRLQLCVQQCV